MSNHSTLSVLSLLVLMLIFVLPGARADTPYEAGLNIRIEAATATAARRGETSRIRFRIVNDSPTTFHVIGIEIPMARAANLIARIGPDEYTTLESLGVSSGETLDLTTSHLWYDTSPVTRDLLAGQWFEMTLMLAEGRLTVPLHVHGRQQLRP